MFDGAPPEERCDRLAARVRWLDGYRRALAIAAAAVISPLLIVRLSEALGADWPRLFIIIFSVMLGVIVWWVIEVCLIYVTALWETEHDRLTRERGLPRAILRKLRR